MRKEFDIRWNKGDKHIGLLWYETARPLDGSPSFEYVQYYLYVFNYVPKGHRFLGYRQMYYDGPHSQFGLWWFNFGWTFPWTSMKDWQ